MCFGFLKIAFQYQHVMILHVVHTSYGDGYGLLPALKYIWRFKK